uniref:Uncharacterized protein n=1 Tax=Rhipicephalus appendiculatus TaxID=34631 RepID=A0A131YBY9_RHIAP
MIRKEYPLKKSRVFGEHLRHTTIIVIYFAYFPRVITTVPALRGHERRARYQCDIAFLIGKWRAPSFQESKREQAGGRLFLGDKKTPFLLDPFSECTMPPDLQQ